MVYTFNSISDFVSRNYDEDAQLGLVEGGHLKIDGIDYYFDYDHGGFIKSSETRQSFFAAAAHRVRKLAIDHTAASTAEFLNKKLARAIILAKQAQQDNVAQAIADETYAGMTGGTVGVNDDDSHLGAVGGAPPPNKPLPPAPANRGGPPPTLPKPSAPADRGGPPPTLPKPSAPAHRGGPPPTLPKPSATAQMGGLTIAEPQPEGQALAVRRRANARSRSVRLVHGREHTLSIMPPTEEQNNPPPAPANKKLAYISFDFDKTLTEVHTWNKPNHPTEPGLGYSRKSIVKHPELFKPAEVPLHNANGMAGLIFDLAKHDITVVILSMQNEDTIFQVLRANKYYQQILKFHGINFFIFGRNFLQANHCGSSKVMGLKHLFGDKVSGIHFDDDDREKTGFENAGILFQKVSKEEGVGLGGIKRRELEYVLEHGTPAEQEQRLPKIFQGVQEIGKQFSTVEYYQLSDAQKVKYRYSSDECNGSYPILTDNGGTLANMPRNSIDISYFTQTALSRLIKRVPVK